MDPKKFARLEKSFGQAIAFEQGKGEEVYVRTVEIKEPKLLGPTEITKIRKRFKMSQPVFAKLLNVSKQTVQAWEQGRTEPSGISMRVLELASKEPVLFIQIVADAGVIKESKRKRA